MRAADEPRPPLVTVRRLERLGGWRTRHRGERRGAWQPLGAPVHIGARAVVAATAASRGAAERPVVAGVLRLRAEPRAWSGGGDGRGRARVLEGGAPAAARRRACAPPGPASPAPCSRRRPAAGSRRARRRSAAGAAAAVAGAPSRRPPGAACRPGCARAALRRRRHPHAPSSPPRRSRRPAAAAASPPPPSLAAAHPPCRGAERPTRAPDGNETRRARRGPPAARHPTRRA